MPAGSGGRLRQLTFLWGGLLATERGRNVQFSTEETPKSVWINRTDRENPAALTQCCGVNPGVQYRPACTLSLLPVRFDLFACAPFDASDLLWKVKSKYDLSLTVLCTVLCKKGRFIALKKSELRGLVPCCFTGPSVAWPGRCVSLTQGCAQMDPRLSPHGPEQWERYRLHQAQGWPGCPTPLTVKTLRALRSPSVS